MGDGRGATRRKTRERLPTSFMAAPVLNRSPWMATRTIWLAFRIRKRYIVQVAARLPLARVVCTTTPQRRLPVTTSRSRRSTHTPRFSTASVLRPRRSLRQFFGHRDGFPHGESKNGSFSDGHTHTHTPKRSIVLSFRKARGRCSPYCEPRWLTHRRHPRPGFARSDAASSACWPLFDLFLLLPAPLRNSRGGRCASHASYASLRSLANSSSSSSLLGFSSFLYVPLDHFLDFSGSISLSHQRDPTVSLVIMSRHRSR
jgi:hypothetical protein